MVDDPNIYIDDQIRRFKEEFEEYTLRQGASQTRKTASLDNTYVDPLVPRETARYVYHNCSVLRKIVQCYSQDILLNNYSLSDPEEDTTKVDELWNTDSQSWQLYLAGIEYFVYGYSALEIVNDDDGLRFQQIPAHTLRIKIETQVSPITGEEYLFFYAEQTINGHTTLLRISNYDYRLLDKWGVEDDSTGECIWIGGCNENDFYDLPAWTSCYREIFIMNAIDSLNYNKLETGNIPAGLFIFQGGVQLRDPNDPNDVPIEDQLEDTFKEKNSGVKFVYLQNASAERDITSDYYQLTDNNYEYLSQLRTECQEEIIEAYGLPKVRLLIDDMKESMNSTKSDTLYEVYNRSVLNQQRFFRQIINLFNRHYLDVKSDIVISVPEFVDKTNTRIETIVELFNTGLLTLGQCLELLTEIYPQITFIEEGFEDDVMYDTRFYKGAILGGNQEAFDKMDSYDDILKEVNNVLSEDNQSLLNRLI